MKIIEVKLPVSFDEQSRMSLFYAALEDGDFDRAVDRFGRLTDPRAVAQAALTLGAAALEECRYLFLLDMVEVVECPKLRFGWLLEILEHGDPCEVDAGELIARMHAELDRIDDDGHFLDRARLALDDLIEKFRQPMLELAGHFDPDIAGLTLVPSNG